MSVPGPHAERLARGAVLQQGAQVVRLVAGLGILTLLARELPLSELGVYALLLSLAAYAQFLKSSVMNAAIVGVADALDDRSRLSAVVSTGFAVYGAIGVVAALILAAVGFLILPVLDIPPDLRGEARIGVAGLAVITAIGWPVQIFDDLLRGQQRFAAVSGLEITAMVLSVCGMVALLGIDAPVWALVTWNAAIPLLTGLCCLLALPFIHAYVPVAPRYVDRTEARRFGSVSGLLAIGGSADLLSYTADRFLLGAIRNAASVGLYEGALQMQNIVRYLNGVLSQPAVPAARRFQAEGDIDRLRELFIAGLRYTLAISVPFVVVLSVLSGPVLATWLGDKFLPVQEEAALFVGWWVVGVNGGLAIAVVTAAGRFRTLARISWTVAVVNIALTLLLTPWLGIWGPVLGGVASFTLSVATMLPLAVRDAGGTWREVVVRAWLPAYSTAAGLAAALILLRVAVPIDPGVETVVVVIAGLATYWLAYAAFWLTHAERQLVRTVVGHRRASTISSSSAARRRRRAP